MPESVKKSFVIFTYCVLILSTLLVFWQVRNFGFINYDDNHYVYENPHVLNGLTIDGIIWAFTTSSFGYWQPLTWVSLMADCQLFGPDPGRIHLVNVFLHLANTLLLFVVLRKMTGALWPSAFVAAAFALHPMHVESVAWISERKDVLSTLFWLLTMLAYVRYVEKPSASRYIVTLIVFALGLMSKPMLVTLPFVLLLLAYWPLERTRGQRTEDRGQRRSSLGWLIVEKIPFLILSVVSSITTFLTQKAGGVIVDTKTIPLMNRVGNAFLFYARYIGKLFVPHNLAVFYSFDAESIAFWQVVMSIVLLIVISVLVIRFGRNLKFLPVGWFWFIVTLVPVIGLVKFTGSAYADRFTYIPYIGLLIMLAWGLPELLPKCPQRIIALGLSMVIVLTFLGIFAHQQVSYWNNNLTLYSHAIEVTQNNYLAYNNLSVAYNNLGRHQEAIEAYSRAVKIKPDYPDAYVNLGVACGGLGRHQDAVEAFKQAIKIEPNHIKAHYNLSIAYENLGRYQDAIEAFKQTIRIKPDYADAYFNLGIACGILGRHQDAIEAFKQVIRIKPDYADAHFNLGVACKNLGRYQDAIGAFKQTIRIKPDYADAYINLGVACGAIGRRQDEIEAYKQAIRINPDYAVAHFNLGIACLEIGDKSSALEEYKILKTLDAEKANELFKLINK